MRPHITDDSATCAQWVAFCARIYPVRRVDGMISVSTGNDMWLGSRKCNTSPYEQIHRGGCEGQACWKFAVSTERSWVVVQGWEMTSRGCGRVAAYDQGGASPRSNCVLLSFAGIFIVVSIQWHTLPVVKEQGLHYVAATTSRAWVFGTHRRAMVLESRIVRPRAVR